MSFSDLLAKTYGIPEHFAVLIEATWHLQTPTEKELESVPYHSHRLPKGIAEVVVTSRARRAINDGVNLQEVLDRISNLEISPNEQIMMEVNEMLKNEVFKKNFCRFDSVQERKQHFMELGKMGYQILKHAAIYQKHILDHEYGGVLPRKLPQMIRQEVNLLRKELGK